MRPLARQCLLLVPCGAIGWLLLATGMSVGEQPPPADRLATRDPRPFIPPAPSVDGEPLPDAHRYVGVSSCAASNCHGGETGPRTPIGSEYTLWIERDPHAQAFSVLYNDESQLIMRNLRNSTDYAQVKEAHQEQLCLNCHTTSASESQLAAGHLLNASDGVGCESCHGPAEAWLSRHVQADWQFLSPEEKAGLGFRNTDDLLTRTRLCTDCHVGSEGRDVNHDLIAAGHPRLNFEMAAYHANYPAHWNRNEDRRRASHSQPYVVPQDVNSWLDATLWAVGQVATAEKSLDLLEQRAAHESAPWPEFAEYGCFACHHDLQVDSFRQQTGYGARRPGSYPWGTWPYALLPLFADESHAEIDLTAPDSAFLQLEAEMGKPLPDRNRVALLAPQVRRDLSRWAERLNRGDYDAGEVRRLLAHFTGHRNDLVPQGWDSATQLWLATVALNQARVDLQERSGRADDTAIVNALREARARLAFPTVKPLDETDRVIRYDSPGNYSRETIEAVQSSLGEIHEILEGNKGDANP